MQNDPLRDVLVASTPRLTIRRLTLADAPFILRMLNDADFLEHIGDKGVRTLEDAEGYLREGPMASCARHGHGLFCVTLRESSTPIGMCGLLKRDQYPDVDLGYAFLPEFRGRGYALEAASAVMSIARGTLGRSRVIALVSPANAASIRLLEKLGFVRSNIDASDPATVVFELDLAS